MGRALKGSLPFNNISPQWGYTPNMYTVEPRFNEVPRDLENWLVNRRFVISRFVFHIFYCDLISLG